MAALEDAGDGGLAVGLFGGEAVVGSAEVADVGGFVGAAEAAGGDVVVFEPGLAVAACAIGGAPGAAGAVAGEDGASDVVGDVAGVRQRW